MEPRTHLQYACIRTFVDTSLYVRNSSWLSPATQPDRFKTYECRPNLFACRVFVPQGNDRQDDLPLVIRAHGGGFILNNPAADDKIARHLADTVRCLVTSIDYSKTPQHKFPTGYEDVVAQVLAILDDQDLAFDRSRVILCGSSAGGNLLLGASQDPRLQSKVHGVAAIYPLLDLTLDGDTKMATRPDPSVPDFMGSSYDGMSRIYLDEANKPDLTDVRLSPTFFKNRESLPPNVMLIGSEHDMFCRDDEVMADKLAALGGGAKVELESGWKAPGVQWYKVYGQPHAFEVFAAKTPEKEEARLKAVDAMFSALSNWVIEVSSGGDK